MSKKWFHSFIICFLSILFLMGGITCVVDPFFHYRKPLRGLSYKIYNERYQNYGIIKNFDYDAIITGTSMVQNFKTSEMDSLFGVNTVKVPFSGGSYTEINSILDKALKGNPNIRIVLWGLDYNRFYNDFDAVSFEEYPTYLCDNNPINDVKYVFNKEVLIKNTLGDVLLYTKDGGVTTTFDQYNNWNASYTFGKDAVISQYTRPEKNDDLGYKPLNKDCIEKNVISLVKDYPNVEFYFFWTPYSIVYFDFLNQTGELEEVLHWEKEALETLLQYDNVHFFSFYNDYEVITNLDNYKDIIHYSEAINSYILICMYKRKNQLSLDNYLEYCDKEYIYYTSYDYDSIFE